MTDYLNPSMSLAEINAISPLGLAHIGDAVYETCARSFLCQNGRKAVPDLHRKTISIVNANAQAEAAARLLPSLQEEELAAYKRGRNAKVNSVPHHSELAQYHAATGLECLFGWLFLQGKTERINELFEIAVGEYDGT